MRSENSVMSSDKYIYISVNLPKYRVHRRKSPKSGPVKSLSQVGKFLDIGFFSKLIFDMSLFSNYFVHDVIFLRKKHVTRRSHWRV